MTSIILSHSNYASACCKPLHGMIIVIIPVRTYLNKLLAAPKNTHFLLTCVSLAYHFVSTLLLIMRNFTEQCLVLDVRVAGYLGGGDDGRVEEAEAVDSNALRERVGEEGQDDVRHVGGCDAPE